MKQIFEKSYPIEQYQYDTRYLDIIASIYVETNPDDDDIGKEASYICSKICPSVHNNTFAVVGSVKFNSGHLPRMVNLHKNRANERPYYQGVREVCHNKPKGYLQQQSVMENFILCGQEGVIVNLLMRPEELHDAIPIMKACPNTTFVLDHAGGIQGLRGDKLKENKWAHTMELLGEQKNVICKISGMAGGWGGDPRVEANGWSFDLQEKYFRHALQCFSDNNIIFGTDYPFCNLNGGDLQHFIDNTERVAKEVGGQVLADKMFHINALLTYNIKLTGHNEKYTPLEKTDRQVSQSQWSNKWKEQKQMAKSDMTLTEMFWDTSTVGRRSTDGP